MPFPSFCYQSNAFQSGLATSWSRDCHSCSPAESICPSGRVEANPHSSSSLSIPWWQNLAPFDPIWLTYGLHWFSLVHEPRTTSVKSFLSFNPLQGFWSLLKCVVCCVGLCQQVQHHPSDLTWAGGPWAVAWLCGVDALPSLATPLWLFLCCL